MDGQTGFIVPVQDKEELIAAVRKFLAMTDEQQQAMGMAGRKYVEEYFNRQKVVDAYMTRIREI